MCFNVLNGECVFPRIAQSVSYYLLDVLRFELLCWIVCASVAYFHVVPHDQPENTCGMNAEFLPTTPTICTAFCMHSY